MMARLENRMEGVSERARAKEKLYATRQISLRISRKTVLGFEHSSPYIWKIFRACWQQHVREPKQGVH